MKLGTVITDTGTHAARFEADHVVLLDAPTLLAALATGIDLADGGIGTAAADEVRRDAALRPPVVLCAGQNYRDHLDEKAPVEVKFPEFFLKAGQTIAAPDAPCTLDELVTRKLDYETELGVVIGKAGRHIGAEQAMDHVFGYVVCNDLTARDRQVVKHSDGSFGLALGPGKNFDGATRVGTVLVTADEFAAPLDAPLKTFVNGGLRQSNTTAAMVFGVPEIIAYLSQLMTLEPGTLILTGTPGGTGWGTDPELGGTKKTPEGCEPATYLAPGDQVTSVVEGVGELAFAVSSPADGR